ncbi:MAG: hypothetical protein WCS57_00760 [Bacillota bacterium]|nr:hypothetical protein [Bacillota bacterium]
MSNANRKANPLKHQKTRFLKLSAGTTDAIVAPTTNKKSIIKGRQNVNGRFGRTLFSGSLYFTVRLHSNKKTTAAKQIIWTAVGKKMPIAKDNPIRVPSPNAESLGSRHTLKTHFITLAQILEGTQRSRASLTLTSTVPTKLHLKDWSNQRKKLITPDSTRLCKRCRKPRAVLFS